MRQISSITYDAQSRVSPTTHTALLAGGALAFALLTTVAALVRIPLPFTPVPITLQVLVVLLSGAVLGRGWGMASQGLYVGAGALGLPIFAGAASGLGGFTAGYLVGFILAPPVVGWILSQKPTALRITGAMTAGLAIIYTCGWAWLAFGLHMGPATAFFAGVHPFLLADLAKALVAAALFMPIRRFVRLPL